MHRLLELCPWSVQYWSIASAQPSDAAFRLRLIQAGIHHIFKLLHASNIVLQASCFICSPLRKGSRCTLPSLDCRTCSARQCHQWVHHLPGFKTGTLWHSILMSQRSPWAKTTQTTDMLQKTERPCALSNSNLQSSRCIPSLCFAFAAQKLVLALQHKNWY